MRLTTRLLLLILLCMAPMIAALIYTQIDLRHRENVELGALALRQAELANADLDSIVEGGRQLLLATAESGLATDCSKRLTALAGRLPAYEFLAVADPEGRIACASNPTLVGRTAPAWLAGLSRTGFSSGVYSTEAGFGAGFLPLGLPVEVDADAAGTGLLIAALDLDWLAQRLQQIESGRAASFRNSHLTVMDRGGTVIARYPDSAQWLGKSGPKGLGALLEQTTPGVMSLTSAAGHQYVAGYVPGVSPPLGVTVVAGLFPPDVLGDLDRLAVPQTALVVLSTILAALVAAIAARHFVLRPIGQISAAAARWSDGDLKVRAEVSQAGELGALATAFNGMATVLEIRDQERRSQAELLESRVAERTRELSETNNRLQVEMAERERSEAALQEGQKLQAVGHLAGGVAHDFNNLLATVLGCLELIQLRVAAATPDRERLSALVARASDAVQRGARLTSRLLTFSRSQQLAPRPADLNRLISDLLTLAGSTIGRRVRVSTELTPDLWPALVDPGQVEAAVLNLCLNARDAMPDGGQLVIRTANETAAAPTADGLTPGRYIRISVADTGTGMGADVLRRAVDPFFTTKGPGASGLGLSQAYGLARQSGGTLRLESTTNQGTVASLLLPWAGEWTDTEPLLRNVEATRRPPLSLRVLLVDDDQAVRQVTADMLRDLGCTVTEAAGGTEALRLLEGAVPDLLVLDYAMPGMNGLQLARAVRNAGVSAPVLLATGYAELSDDGEATDQVFEAMLRKPFTLRDLHAVITRLLNQTRGGPNVVTLRRQKHG